MARMVPEDVRRFAGGEGEAEVYEALRSLPRDCTVIYSMNWLRPSRGFRDVRPQGEGDFIVFDPARGILVIEVKGGDIRFEDGRCIQRNRNPPFDERRVDPAGQANNTAFFLRKVFQDDAHTADCLIRHAVWFPSGNLPSDTDLPFDYHRHMTFDLADLRRPAEAVSRAFAYWNAMRRHQLTPVGIERLLRRLMPCVAIVPSVRAKLEDRERILVQLTAEQSALVDFLDDQRVAVVSGTAGTGKTLVGLEKARRLADSGGTVAFLCFNTALRNYLAATQKHPGIDFHTFHSLARVHGATGNHPAAVAERFVKHLAGNGALLSDHVIVDEGQDFEGGWLDGLATRVQGAFYVFFDRHQLVQRGQMPNWLERAECRLTLRRNVRNTTEIAKFATRCAALTGRAAPESVAGPRPNLHRTQDRESGLRLVDRLVAAPPPLTDCDQRRSQSSPLRGAGHPRSPGRRISADAESRRNLLPER